MCGEYLIYMNRYFGENNIEIKMEKGDLEILKEGCVDFYIFSYYMFICVSSDFKEDNISGNILGGVKNLYFKFSEWGW